MGKIQDRATNISNEEFKRVASNANSYVGLVRELGLNDMAYNSAIRLVKLLFERTGIEFKHEPQKLRKQNRKPHVTKCCPVCDKEFSTSDYGETNGKMTCSYACSNTYFRSGKRNGAYKHDRVKKYPEICFEHHKYECIICGENLIVSVHHYNGDHDDNRPENLVPLCQTHHQYVHSRYRHLVEKQIDTYVQTFLDSRTQVTE